MVKSVYWNGTNFVAEESFHRSHLEALEIHKYKTVQFLRRCSFQLEGYKVIDGEVVVDKGFDFYFEEQHEGTDFVICLHLFVYLMEGYLVDSESFKPFLHSNLFNTLEHWFAGWESFHPH